MSPELQEAREREDTFISSVSQKTASSRAGGQSFRNRSKKFSKSKLSRALPLIFIFLITGVLAVSAFFIQSFLPVALATRFREEFNSTGVSSIMRSDIILDYQLSSPNTFYALSDTQREALDANGIVPVDIESPTASTVLVYPSSLKEYTIVAPSEISSSSDSIASAVSSSLKDNNLKFSGRVLSVSEALKTPSFKDKYTIASKQWRGGSSGWYDTFENLNEARLSISRTRYATWATMVLNSGTNNIWKKLAAGEISPSDSGISAHLNQVDVDADGNETVTTTSGNIDSNSIKAGSTPEQVYSVLNSKVASVLKGAATVGCAGVEIANAISTVVEAKQTYEYLNLAVGTLESFDGQKAGLDDYPEVAERYLDDLTTADPESGKTPMEAPGIMETFTGETITEDSPGVDMTNFQSLLNQIGTLSSDIALTADAFKACSYIKLSVAGVNFATTILSFVPVIGQASAVLQIATRTIAHLALGVAVGTVASFIIPKILDSVVENMTKNVATEWTGVEKGNAFAAGARKYIVSNYQIGGGTPASEENYLAYKKTSDAVLAAEAETDRRLRSPLDISSPNTFLGSLAYAAVPLATSSNVLATMKNLANLTRTSLSGVLPGAFAVAETDLVQSRGSCPAQESAGAVGDALTCQEYYAEDTSTIYTNPEEVINTVASLDENNFKSINPDGTQEINPDSSLGHFITRCSKRLVAFGKPDAEIASEIVNPPNTLVASTPLLGDLAEIANSMSEIENMPWISGSACVFSSENDKWPELKWYQRYMSDQRGLENADLLAQSSVSTFLAKYYEEQPLDNSPAGILARYSGLEKEEVIAALDYIDGLTFLANYDASNRLDFSQNKDSLSFLSLFDLKNTHKKSLDEIIEHEKPETTPATSPKYIIYDITELRATSA